MIKSLLTEYGLPWAINRSLYSAKLKMMAVIPVTEKLFEKKVDVHRIDIFNINIEKIKDYLLGLSKEIQNEIVSAADNAIKGKINCFFSIELDYGNPINWHYSPLTKVESSKDVKWYQIPDFDPVRGDIKVVWEISRFTHFFYFSRAYMITGDKKYYDAFSVQLEQWLKENPYPYGVNYKCGQECTLRMINVLMAYTVFKFYGAVTVKDEKNISKLVEVCYKKILANFFYAEKCIKNNHTLSEICGLIIGAWCCEDEKRIRKAYKLLNKEVKKQFIADGGYIQYSFNYQRFALQIMECIFKLSEKTGIFPTERTMSRVKTSIDLMYQMQDLSGDMPNYGSNDGALIFPITACGYRDYRPVLNTTYALVEGKRLYEHGLYDEELLWFSSGMEVPLSDIERKASAFNNSGFYTLRHDCGFLMICLQNFKSRPAHMDQLHIDLWHKGINIFCDSGTYSYASELGKELASTAGHNTMKMDGIEQMNKWGAFLVCDWTDRTDVKHDDKSFSGTMVSKNGYTHRRTILKTEQGYDIEDEVNGNGEYCVFHFHTPCNVRIVQGGFELIYKDSVMSFIEVNSGDIIIQKAYISLYYLKKEEINCVSVKFIMHNKKCSWKFVVRLIS